MRNENVFREAREIARHCTAPMQRFILKQRIDECFDTFNQFKVSASKRDFELLIARWTRLLLAIDAVEPMASPPTENGGRLHAPPDRAAVG